MSADTTIVVVARLRLPVSKMIPNPPTEHGTSETRRVVATREVSATLAVDAGALLRLLGAKAAGSKRRRSVEAGGKVSVHVHYVGEPVPRPEPFEAGGWGGAELVEVVSIQTPTVGRSSR